MAENIVSSADGSLKRISGRILLFLYQLQRQVGGVDDVLTFDRKMKDIGTLEQVQLGKELSLLCNGAISDVFNGLRFLSGKGFITYKESNDSMSYNFLGIEVTASGVDVVEDIEQGTKEREKFAIVFNFKLADVINMESLIKAEVESVFKASMM